MPLGIKQQHSIYREVINTRTFYAVICFCSTLYMDNSDVATVEGERKDWINELPDCIMSYILSFLTIKDAAETSIVCRRWTNLWKTRSSDLKLD